MSLDGFIATPDGGYDWIPTDPEIDFGALLAQFDTLVMGRKTYEVMQSHDGGVDERGVYGKETIVFSRTLSPTAHPHVHVTAEDLATTVAALKAAAGKDVWLFGGGDLFRQLADAGLVDSVEVAVIPVLLGDGVPLIPAGPRIALSLTGHRVYGATGTMLLEYAVTR